MVNEGQTLQNYEPYGYKIPISCGGENLLDESASSDADATHINYNKSAPVILTAGQIYTFSCDTTCNGLYIRNATDDSALTSANNSSTLTYTPQANVRAYFRIWNSNGITNLKPMLNLGSTAKPYAPYSRQTTPVYLGQTQTVRRIKKLVLTGEENWDFASSDSNRTVCKINLHGRFVVGYCTHINWKRKDAYAAQEYNRIVYDEYLYVSLENSILDAQTTDAFKSYLAQQYQSGTPVNIWYVLAEPETGIVNEPLCKIGDYADELHSTDAGVSIPTAKGSNTLTVDTDLQPSEMTITYIKEGQ
jgi:hypothetical protein